MMRDDELDSYLDWEELSIDEDEEKLLRLVDRLKKAAPHIRWRVRTEEHELGPYDTLCVPEEQVQEAEFLLKLVRDKKRLRGYWTEWMFPEIYECRGNRWGLKPAIRDFIDLAREFTSLVSRIKDSEVSERIAWFSRIMPQILEAAARLPDIASPYWDTESGFIDRNDWPSFGDAEQYWVLDDPYDPKCVVDKELTENLQELYDVLWTGLYKIQEEDGPREISEVVGYWRFETESMRQDLLGLAAALEAAKERIKEGKAAPAGGRGLWAFELAKVLQRCPEEVLPEVAKVVTGPVVSDGRLLRIVELSDGSGRVEMFSEAERRWVSGGGDVAEVMGAPAASEELLRKLGA